MKKALQILLGSAVREKTFKRTRHQCSIDYRRLHNRGKFSKMLRPPHISHDFTTLSTTLKIESWLESRH
jgi:hypothetical protein